MLPALFFVVWVLHTRLVVRLRWIRQLFFLAASIVAGCYLVRIGNKSGYYAVMKTAPPVGTLWVWSVIEMELVWALMHVFVVGGFMWVNGYSAF